jgi:hypothetical protein
MKANPEFEKRHQHQTWIGRKQQKDHELGSGLPEPRISEVPRLDLSRFAQRTKPSRLNLIYDQTNAELHAAVRNLRHFFPELFARLEAHQGTVYITETELDPGLLGDTNSMLASTHLNYDVVPLTKEKGDPNRPDSPLRKNHVYDGEIVDLNTDPKSPPLKFRVPEVYVKISRTNILASLFNQYKTSVEIKHHLAAKQYHATLAHELLGHAEYTLSHPEWEAKWNKIHDQMTQTNMGQGHEVFNPDGENAVAIGNHVRQQFDAISEDAAFIPF